MQRNLSLNSRQYELLVQALGIWHNKLFYMKPGQADDEVKMLLEEIAKLKEYLVDNSNNAPGGTYIDGKKI